MILRVPDLDTLRIALTSGIIPPDVSCQPVQAKPDGDGGLLVRCRHKLSATVLQALRRLGIEIGRAKEDQAWTSYTCWPQLLPLERSPRFEPPAAQTPVLFELEAANQLAVIASEMLRLGNDRQGFRWLEADGSARALLRVIGPPYYSLLRALEPPERTRGVRAYVEAKHRVWLPIGSTHPLLEQLQCPEGKNLLLRSTTDWTWIDDEPFRDIFEIIEFVLPATPSDWRPTSNVPRFRIPLRLRRASTADQAQLWVVRHQALQQIEEMIQSTDDGLVSRLAFAAIDGKDPIVVVRTRPSRETPPVVVLDAVSFRPYLKLPNLFVPCGYNLHPPLRRDVVRKLLADNPDRITWLYPTDEGGFVAESVPDGAFLPLEQWVDYIVDREQSSLNAWLSSNRFDFESFVCREVEKEKGNSRKRGKTSGLQAIEKDGGEEADDTADEPVSPPQIKVVRKTKTKAPVAETGIVAEKTPSTWQRRVEELETEFLKLDSPLDDPRRLPIWRALGEANAALGNIVEASVCWTHLLWEDETPSQADLHAWMKAELQAATSAEEFLTEESLDHLLAQEHPRSADLRALAATLVWSAERSDPPDFLIRRLEDIRPFLEKHEVHLPARTAWLAWCGMSKLAHGDVLALIRARDRLLERLLQNGLRADTELPSFLRFGNEKRNQRFKTVRERVANLRDLAQMWLGSEHTTGAYVDLMFAYGLARLGEHVECDKLMTAAEQKLHRANSDAPHVHNYLLSAFAWRIKAALEQKPNSGPLPDIRVDIPTQGKALPLDRFPRLDRYVVDRLRQHSRILEPHEEIDPYRNWWCRFADEPIREVMALYDIRDRDQLARQMDVLWQRYRDKNTEISLLPVALELAPRLGEEFARHMLGHVPELSQRLFEQLLTRDRVAGFQNAATLLGKALFLAAHYDNANEVTNLVRLFERLLTLMPKVGIQENLVTLVENCLRGLRKLGMREQIGMLLSNLADAILEGEDWHAFGARLLLTAKEGKALGQKPARLRALLHVAGGWYYLGHDDNAVAVVDLARDLLFANCLSPTEQTKLARAYAATLAQAPVDDALQRIEELFYRLEGVSDTYTTNSHYSLSRLDVVEAVVLAVAHDDFVVGQKVRRWLDEEEYLIRRRIHRDVRDSLARADLG
ncbi:MAG: hypothetical protein KatS3mg105_1907 [Gemmatales bacterium]|nr:MAG: hypothetical protein KatS3mg105_1907 [Gemmatales bacterium]